MKERSLSTVNVLSRQFAGQTVSQLSELRLVEEPIGDVAARVS